MSDIALLLLVLFSFYLTDSSLWLTRDTVVFLSTLGRAWRPTVPHALLSRKEKGLFPAFRLPPLAPVYLCRPLGINVSPQGFCLAPPSAGPEDASATSLHPIRFIELCAVTTEGRTVRVNGRPHLHCQTGSQATFLARLLTELAPLSEDKRAASLAQLLIQALDPGRIRADVEAHSQDVLPLRLLCNGLFLYLFVALPVILTQFEPARIYVWVIATVVGLVGAIAVEFFRIHRRHWPTEKQERFSTLLHFILYLPSAIRASDLVSHRLLSLAHPLAAAYVLCPPGTFHRFARRFLRRLYYPVPPPAVEPQAAGIVAWSNALERDCVRAFLRAHRIEESALLQPPSRPDDQSRSYCPRCETSYTVHEGTCGDCPGVALMPYLPPHLVKA
jgi:hypothetical protein